MMKYIYFKIPIEGILADGDRDFGICTVKLRVIEEIHGNGEKTSIIKDIEIIKGSISVYPLEVRDECVICDTKNFYFVEDCIPVRPSRTTVQLIIPRDFWDDSVGADWISACKNAWHKFVYGYVDKTPTERDVEDWIRNSLWSCLESKIEYSNVEPICYQIVDKLVSDKSVILLPKENPLSLEEKLGWILVLKRMLPPRISEALTFGTYEVNKQAIPNIYSINFAAKELAADQTGAQCEIVELTNNVSNANRGSFAEWCSTLEGAFPDSTRWNNALAIANNDPSDNRYDKISDCSRLNELAKAVLLMDKFEQSQSLADFNECVQSDINSEQRKKLCKKFFECLSNGEFAEINDESINNFDYQKVIGNLSETDYLGDNYQINPSHEKVTTAYLGLLWKIYYKDNGSVADATDKYLLGKDETYNYSKVKDTINDYFASVISFVDPQEEKDSQNENLSNGNSSQDKTSDLNAFLDKNSKWFDILKKIVDASPTSTNAVKDCFANELQNKMYDNSGTQDDNTKKSIDLGFLAKIYDAISNSNYPQKDSYLAFYKNCLQGALDGYAAKLLGKADAENCRGIIHLAMHCNIVAQLARGNEISNLIRSQDVKNIKDCKTAAESDSSGKLNKQKDLNSITIWLIILILFVVGEFFGGWGLCTVLPWEVLLANYAWLDSPQTVCLILFIGLTVVYIVGSLGCGKLCSRNFMEGSLARIETQKAVFYMWGAIAWALFIVCVAALFGLSAAALNQK